MSEAQDKAGWCVTDAKCPYCGHEWTAVHPVSALTLECPHCSIQPEADPITGPA